MPEITHRMTPEITRRMTLEEKYAETQAALNHVNEVRRALIRGLLAEAGKLQERRLAYLEAQAHNGGPAFDNRYWPEITKPLNRANSIAYDIASLSAGPGYFVRNEIQGWDVKRVLDEIQQ
jgi:hypothetical protein